MKKVKVGDYIIVANKGEIKAYEAKPRTPEAELGLKEEEVKIELFLDKNYIDAHKKLQDIVTDDAGRFKGDATNAGGSIAEEHNLEIEIENRILQDLAKDINELLEKAPKRVFVAINEEYAPRVFENVEKSLQEKIVKLLKKDYVKLPKEELLETFNNA